MSEKAAIKKYLKSVSLETTTPADIHKTLGGDLTLIKKLYDKAIAKSKLSTEEKEILTCIKKDELPPNKIALLCDKTKSQVNKILYALLAKKLVRKQAEEDGTKPKWKAK
jgi:helix-turn-helix protein